MKKLNRKLLVRFNRFIKSHKKVYASLLIIFVLLCFNRFIFFNRFTLVDYILFSYFISLLWAFIRAKKYYLQRKTIKKDNIASLMMSFIIFMFISGYYIGYDDNLYSDNMIKALVSSDDLKSIENIEKYLNENNNEIFRYKSNDSYVIKVLITNNKVNKDSLILQLAENNLLNSNIKILFNNKDIEKNISKLIYCGYYRLNKTKVDINFSIKNSIKKVTVNIDSIQKQDINKMKKVINTILLTNIDNLKEENIVYVNN